MTDTQFVLVFLLGWVFHAGFIRIHRWIIEQDRKDMERIYDWDRNDDEFGW